MATGDPGERSGAPEQPQTPPPGPLGPPPGPPGCAPPGYAPPGYGRPGYGPPGHGPPGYGTSQSYGQAGQQYGEQPYGYPPGTAAHPVGGGQRFGIAGAMIAAAGAITVVLAFTVLHWLRDDPTDEAFSPPIYRESTFSRLHRDLTRAHDEFSRQGALRYVHFGISYIYFGWLAWALFAVAVVGAFAAVLPSAFSGILRAAGLVIGLAAAGLTVWAIDLIHFSGPLEALSSASPGFGDYLAHAHAGFWVAVGGFLLLAVGAAMGPRRA